MNQPNFLIIGAQKSGTTWLHHHLRSHPDIFMPTAKEQSYFCWEQGDQAYSWGKYLTYFNEATTEKAIGEATASYFWTDNHPPLNHKPYGYQTNIPQRIKHELGKAIKFILTLRNPVERAISAYFHHIAFGSLNKKTSFTEAEDFIGLRSIGLYSEHLANWLTVFPKENFLILIQELDIKNQPQQTLQRCYTHLAVHTRHQATQIEKKQFPGLHRITFNREIWIPKPGIETGQITTIPYKSIPDYYACKISQQEIVNLKKLYKEDVEKLCQLIEIDLFKIWDLSY